MPAGCGVRVETSLRDYLLVAGSLLKRESHPLPGATIPTEGAAGVTILVFGNEFVTSHRHSVDKTFTEASQQPPRRGEGAFVAARRSGRLARHVPGPAQVNGVSSVSA